MAPAEPAPYFLFYFFNSLSLSFLISLFYFLHSEGDTGLRVVMWVRGDRELIMLSNRSHRDLELQAHNAIKFSSHLPATPASKLGTG